MPDPVAPLDVSGVRTVTVGTVLFALAFVALLPQQDRLADQGRTWWLWTCVVGVGLGVFGIAYCRRRRPAPDELAQDGLGGPPA